MFWIVLFDELICLIMVYFGRQYFRLFIGFFLSAPGFVEGGSASFLLWA